jgi:hypothetical protein
VVVAEANIAAGNGNAVLADNTTFPGSAFLACVLKGVWFVGTNF